MKKLKSILLIAFICIFMCSCTVSDVIPGKSQGSESAEDLFRVYYLNGEQSGLESYDYVPESVSAEDLINELIEKLQTTPDATKYRTAFTENTVIVNTWLENGLLTITFDESYNEMDSASEVLCRASVVRTLCQIDGVDFVAFVIGQSPLVDHKNNIIGAMNEDSFVENPGATINTIQQTTLTLYFASLDGKSLVAENQVVHYSSNISIEKLVMERLIEGPLQDYDQICIPQGTELVSVSVMDGVCFVNISDGFLKQNYDIEEDVIIYSIVNSLTELDSVSKVQISVNGETDMVYRETASLSTVYEQDKSMVITPNQAIEVQQNSEEEVEDEKLNIDGVL